MSKIENEWQIQPNCCFAKIYNIDLIEIQVQSVPEKQKLNWEYHSMHFFEWSMTKADTSAYMETTKVTTIHNCQIVVTNNMTLLLAKSQFHLSHNITVLVLHTANLLLFTRGNRKYRSVIYFISATLSKYILCYGFCLKNKQLIKPLSRTLKMKLHSSVIEH